jgi:AraC family transcriptional regulator of adaptative response/methylated-DNA-[protein]-cysteine methyltransferase
MGITPRGYADQVRLHRLKQRLRKKEDVTTAMYEAGYGSSSRLYERSNDQLGMTPATYGKGGRGMEIHYTIAPSPPGRLLVAGTTRGVSAIYLGDSDAQLTATLRREYPEAQISRSPARVSRWVRQIVRHLGGRQPQLDLPLDIQGTAFQRRVWEALRRIPYGETRSYTDVARELGRPQARRAVARACATNPVSLVIPCHRVVRSDGGLGGYGGGIARKRALLDRESHVSGKL